MTPAKKKRCENEEEVDETFKGLKKNMERNIQGLN